MLCIWYYFVPYFLFKINLNKDYLIKSVKANDEELSIKAEIDLYELKKIENGFKMPNLKEIVNICNFFKIGTQEFLEYEDVWIAK